MANDRSPVISSVARFGEKARPGGRAFFAPVSASRPGAVRVDPGSGWDRRGRLVVERNTEEAMNMNLPIQRARRPITAGLAVAVAIGMLAAGPTVAGLAANAVGPAASIPIATVGLGTAGSFGVLAGTTVT